MPNDKATPKELKVTDKRIFTPEGEIREEFRQDIRPGSPQSEAAAPAPAPAPEPPPSSPAPGERAATGEKPPASPYFTALVDQLFVQGAMFLGMAPKGYPATVKPNPAAAREMIEMLSALQQKTEGNLADEEAEFLRSALSELKLAYVQRTKNI